MAYRLKYTDSSEFTGMLVNTIKMWRSEEPDMVMIASDGVHVKTQRIILAFYSPFLRCLLADTSGDINHGNPGGTEGQHTPGGS